MALEPQSAEKAVGDALEYLRSIEMTHILSTTALEVFSYSQSIEAEIRAVMDSQIDWTAPGSIHRVPPEEIDGVMEGARKEVADGFQRLNSQTLVALWGGLEVLVEDLFVAWIGEHPECLNQEVFQKLKVSLADFMRMDEDGRRRSLYQICVASLASARSLGVTRFEAVLHCLGLSGSVEAEVAEALYELHITRNLLVHQGGRVDTKFRQSDLGSGFQLGDKIYLYGIQFRNYKAAVFAYATLLRERVQAHQRRGATVVENGKDGSRKTD